MALDAQALGRLLQISSASLPVGAFAYSEGLEYLVAENRVNDQASLGAWLSSLLQFGPIRVDAAIISRIMMAVSCDDLGAIYRWDAWLVATRESEELREQGKMMARALWRLSQSLENPLRLPQPPDQYVSVYAALAAHWQLPIFEAIYAYIHSWLSNLVTAGVKLIPLGQLQGQQLIAALHEPIHSATNFAIQVRNEDLYCWTAGQSLASMGHETQYSRLYRS